jgi:hypothetical protein
MLYDCHMVSTIFNKVNAALLEEMVVDAIVMKAQQLVDYIMHNPIVNAVILLHDPNSNTIGTRERDDLTRHAKKTWSCYVRWQTKKYERKRWIIIMRSLQKIMLKHVVRLSTFLTMKQCYCTVHGVHTRSYAWLPCLVFFSHVTPLGR